MSAPVPAEIKAFAREAGALIAGILLGQARTGFGAGLRLERALSAQQREALGAMLDMLAQDALALLGVREDAPTGSWDAMLAAFFRGVELAAIQREEEAASEAWHLAWALLARCRCCDGPVEKGSPLGGTVK
jgi:hypothetical protein